MMLHDAKSGPYTESTVDVMSYILTAITAALI